MSDQEILTIDHAGTAFRFPLPVAPHFIHKVMQDTGTFYEDVLLDYLRDQVDQDGYALDCGANIGTHSVYFAGVMGLRTIAFEPVDSNRKLLEGARTLNGLEAMIEIRPCAVGDTEGTVHLATENVENPGMFKVSEAGDQVAPLVTLDGCIDAATTPIRLIKVDVEGFEDAVLRGAQKVIKTHRPLVVTELADRPDYKRIRAILSPLGYYPIAIFNATPTVVFVHKSNSGMGLVDRIRTRRHISRTYRKREEKLARR